MNNETRTKLTHIKTALETIHEQLDTLASEEQDKFDNLSEGLQEAESGQAIQEAAETLANAASSVEDSISSLNEIQ